MQSAGIDKELSSWEQKKIYCLYWKILNTHYRDSSMEILDGYAQGLKNVLRQREFIMQIYVTVQSKWGQWIYHARVYNGAK